MSNVIRYFTSYTGISLPLKLVGEIEADTLQNRNTYFEGHFDENKRLNLCRKLVYGDIELEHLYHYDEQGKLTTAEISNEDEERETLHFDAQGQVVR